MELQRKSLRIRFVGMVGVLSIALLIGCGYKTVYVPHGDAVRLRQPLKNVKVWVKTKDAEIVPGKMTIPAIEANMEKEIVYKGNLYRLVAFPDEKDLPEGWYCLPLDEYTNLIK